MIKLDSVSIRFCGAPVRSRIRSPRCLLLVRPCLALVALVVPCSALSGPAPSRAFCLSPLAFLLLPRILLKMKSFLLILFEMARGHWRGASTCAFASCTCLRVRAMCPHTPPRTHLHARLHYASARASAYASAAHPRAHSRRASALPIRAFRVKRAMMHGKRKRIRG